MSGCIVLSLGLYLSLSLPLSCSCSRSLSLSVCLSPFCLKEGLSSFRACCRRFACHCVPLSLITHHPQKNIVSTRLKLYGDVQYQLRRHVCAYTGQTSSWKEEINSLKFNPASYSYSMLQSNSADSIILDHTSFSFPHIRRSCC